LVVLPWIEPKLIIQKKWSSDAVSFILEKEHGHVVGTVMRTVTQCKQKGTEAFQQSIRRMRTCLIRKNMS
jgi:hypothetical protein